MSTKILDIGCGKNSLAEVIFQEVKDKKITRLDADWENRPDWVRDITEPLPEELRGQFDLVLVSHVLEHIGRKKVFDAFRHSISAVKNLGEVWFITPSLEWAANEIINQRDGVHVQMLLYGDQNNEWGFHKCAFTLASLRQMVEICGLLVRKAYQSPFTVIGNGREYGAIQNIVIGARFDGLNDPAEAIAEEVAVPV